MTVIRRLGRRGAIAAKMCLVAGVCLGGLLLSAHAFAQSVPVAASAGPTIGEQVIGQPREHCESNLATAQLAADGNACGKLDVFGNGRPLAPGTSHSTTLRLSNDGSSAVRSLALVMSECREAGPARALDRSDHLCSEFRLRVVELRPGLLAVPIVDGTLGDIEGRTLQLPSPPTPGHHVLVRFTVTLSPHPPPPELGSSVSQSVRWRASA